MRMYPVGSDNIEYAGYDEKLKILQIQFTNGTYEYYDVPKIVYQGLMSASSATEYLNEYIKGKYRYSRI